MKNKPRLFFAEKLLDWHATANHRSLPWKNEKDPYKIWLSEVILQQTRSLQGVPYYLSFTDAFQSVHHLAAASDDEVFRLWQGLGYYNRCKNMLATARYIAGELGGKFPNSYSGLLQLKGIGPYTAAAIASFAFGLPHAVVDGNVYRVLARYFGIETPFDTTGGKKEFSSLAQELLDSDSPAYNQAIMDFGATVCTPQNPLCDQCPLQKNCIAFNRQLVDILPVKSKKTAVRKRYFHYLLLHWQDTIWIHKRAAGDIWENLHEPLLIEGDKPLDLDELLLFQQFKELNLKYDDINYVYSCSQRLTHQQIEARFFSLRIKRKPLFSTANGSWMTINDIKKAAFPKTLVSFLENNLYF
jgi:A/G-specific adenine glycosylase